MNFNKKLSIAALAVTLLAPVAASAAPTSYIFNETYLSGAVFNGSLTFDDANGALLSGTGHLSPSPFDFGSIYSGSPTFGISVSSTVGYTWLVDYTSNYGILVEWDYSNPTDIVLLTASNGVYDGPSINVSNIDHAVTTQFGKVAEPGSLALMAAGLLSFGVSRKVKKQA